MVHRRQELERKEAEEELAQAREAEEEANELLEQVPPGEEVPQVPQAPPAPQAPLVPPGEEELQAQGREKLGEENPSHALFPPDEANETKQESGLLPSSKRFKSCF